VLARRFGHRNRFTEFGLGFPQLHAAERYVCQPFQRILLLFGDPMRHGIGNGQGAHGKAVGIAQRNARIEADGKRTRHHGACREPFVARCIGHHQDALLLHSMVAEADGAGNLLQFNSNAGLEPVAVFFSDAKIGYGGIEQDGQQPGDVIKCRFRRGARNPVLREAAEPFFFVGVVAHRFTPSLATRLLRASSLGRDSDAENFMTC